MLLKKTANFSKRIFNPYRTIEEGHIRPLLLNFANLNYIEVNNNHHYHSHTHRHYELIIPIKGSYCCNLNTHPLTIKPDELIFIQHSDIHEDFYQTGSSFIAIIFNMMDLSHKTWNHNIISRNSPATERIVKLEKGSSIHAQKQIIVSETNKNNDSPILIITLIETFFWMIALALPERNLSNYFRNCLQHNVFRQKVFDVFARNIMRKMDTKILAKELGLSLRSLNYKFKKRLGTSPAVAFNNYKVNEAITLLESGKNISETAELLGFANSFHFSKVFKRYTGNSPSKIKH